MVIITFYNGQAHLIRRLLRSEGAGNAASRVEADSFHTNTAEMSCREPFAVSYVK